MIHVALKEEPAKHVCSCGKSYTHHSSYYRHKAKCSFDKKPETTEQEAEAEVETEVETTQELKVCTTTKVADTPSESELIRELLNANKELMNENKQLVKQIVDIVPRIGDTNTNCNNNNFNITLYLNENCKAALSVQDFAKGLQSITDMDTLSTNPQKLITAITEKLTTMTQVERPFQSYEEKLYIKDCVQGWEDDATGKCVDIVHREVGKIDFNRIAMKYPNWRDSGHRDSAKYAEEVAAATSDLKEKHKKQAVKSISKACEVVPDDGVNTTT
jgi:hypothetical protein